MAAKDKDQIVCHVCGFGNSQGSQRCVSCGAKLEELTVDYAEEEAAARANQQEGFEVKWAAISLVIYLLLQGIVLGALPLIIGSYDPQGFAGLVISVVVWFVGGIIVGVLSPGKTFLEPAVGALVAAIPTVVFLHFTTPEGFRPTTMAYVVCGVLGCMISLFGAFLGEQVQKRRQKG